MGIFDKLKFRKSSAEKQPAKPAKPKAEKKADAKKAQAGEERGTVVAPDGRLVSAPKKSEARTKKIKPKKEDTGEAYRFLMKPLITEKASSLGMFGQYAFVVSTAANKVEIRKAIKKVYGVEPIKINVMNVLGKEIRYGRTKGRTKNWKKAVVTLAPGQKIEIQEGL